MHEDPTHAKTSPGVQVRSRGRRARICGAVGALATVGVVVSPALARAADVASKALPTRTVAFTGHYKGNVALLIDNSKVTISSVAGKGTGTLVGASTVSGTGSASASAQCDPFSGTGAIAGPGTRIDFLVTSSSSQGCSSGESGPITVTFKGVAKATSGTGKAKGVSGDLTFKGSLHLGNTTGSQKGAFTVTVTGRLALKG